MSNDLVLHQDVLEDRATSLSLITHEGYMDRVMRMANLMASSKVTVPKHLQGNEGDCAAIVIQSMNWGMNPFAVSQKTHLVNGILGYEAQLVNAVIMASNAIKGSFKYEYKGDGDSMECRVGAVLNGQNEVTWGEWLKVSSVTTKNSPLWKTNPKQQIGYLQVKNWARAFCPGSIMGIYTADELEDTPLQEKDITGDVVQEKPIPTYYTNDEFASKKPEWKEVVTSGRKSNTDFISFIESRGKLFTEAQRAEVMAWKVKSQGGEVDDPFVAELNSVEQGEKL